MFSPMLAMDILLGPHRKDCLGVLSSPISTSHTLTQHLKKFSAEVKILGSVGFSFNLDIDA